MTNYKYNGLVPILNKYYPLFVIIGFFLVYGWQGRDFTDFEILASKPFNLYPLIERQFLHSSPFTFFLGAVFIKIFGTYLSYYFIGSMGIIFFITIFIYFIKFRYKEYFNNACILMFMSPILLIIFKWFGKSDAFLIGFFFLLVLANSDIFKSFLSVLMVFCHRDIALLILLQYL